MHAEEPQKYYICAHNYIPTTQSSNSVNNPAKQEAHKD